MSDEETKNIVIKDFFKSSVILNELDEALKFKPDTLIGIDQVSSEKLIENNVKSIQELAHLSLENLPDIKEIPPIITSNLKAFNLKYQQMHHKKRYNKPVLKAIFFITVGVREVFLTLPLLIQALKAQMVNK